MADNFQLKAIITAVDRLSGPLKGMQRQLKGFQKEVSSLALGAAGAGTGQSRSPDENHARCGVFPFSFSTITQSFLRSVYGFILISHPTFITFVVFRLA
ncbi:hypothetical protein QHV40_003826 [Escherichia coli]|nr:hypothetical protein [Escherichia coli]